MIRSTAKSSSKTLVTESTERRIDVDVRVGGFTWRRKMGKMINHLEYGNIESIYFKKVIQIRKVVLVLKKGIQMSILKSYTNEYLKECFQRFSSSVGDLRLQAST